MAPSATMSTGLVTDVSNIGVSSLICFYCNTFGSGYAPFYVVGVRVGIW